MKSRMLLFALLLPFFTEAQRIGIGTSNPTAKLEVHHRSTAMPGLKLVDSATNLAGVIEFRNVSYSRGIKIAGFSTNNFHAGQYLDFKSDSITVLTIKGNGFMGIRDVEPSYPLDVKGDINTSGSFRINGNAGTPGQILTSNGTLSPVWAEGSPKMACRIRANSSFAVPAVDGNTLQPVPFDVEEFDDGDLFNATGGYFTAPVAGVYSFAVSVLMTTPILGGYSVFLKPTSDLGSGSIAYQETAGGPGTRNSVSLNIIHKMNAGERVYVFVSGPTSAVGYTVVANASTYFSAARLY